MMDPESDSRLVSRRHATHTLARALVLTRKVEAHRFQVCPRVHVPSRTPSNISIVSTTNGIGEAQIRHNSPVCSDVLRSPWIMLVIFEGLKKILSYLQRIFCFTNIGISFLISKQRR